MAEDILRRLVHTEREQALLVRELGKLGDMARRLEQRQSEIIGVLVEAKLWSVDARTGRSTRSSASADRHSDADGEGSEGGFSCPARNPRVRQDPPRWKNAPMKGKLFSECSVFYLRQLAAFIDWCADRDEEAGVRTSTGKPRAPFLRNDAQLARDWASFHELRNREDR